MHDVALLILDNPRLVLVAVARTKRLKALSWDFLIITAQLTILLKQLPWPNMTMVETVEDDAP